MKAKSESKLLRKVSIEFKDAGFILTASRYDKGEDTWNAQQFEELHVAPSAFLRSVLALVSERVNCSEVTLIEIGTEQLEATIDRKNEELRTLKAAAEIKEESKDDEIL